MSHPGERGPAGINFDQYKIDELRQMFGGTDYIPRSADNKNRPHGWEENYHAGVRGPWCAASEEELLQHLIHWLKHCETCGVRDHAGNVYYVVDSVVVKQTLESLQRYSKLLTQPLGQQVTDVWRDTGKAGQGVKGVI